MLNTQNTNQNLFYDYLNQSGAIQKYYCHDAHTNGTVHSNNSGTHLDSKMIGPDGSTTHHDDHSNSSSRF